VLISAHGLGGQADAQDTIELARKLSVVALSISAPGNGDSEGIGPSAEDPRPILAVRPRLGQEPDIPVSWLYQYIYALLGAVTYATTLPEVDPHGVIVTGVRMGGLATFAVGAIDRPG
jgi:dienelactone hydrolase